MEEVVQPCAIVCKWTCNRSALFSKQIHFLLHVSSGSLSVSRMSQGKYFQNCSTSFNPVAEHKLTGRTSLNIVNAAAGPRVRVPVLPESAQIASLRSQGDVYG